MAGPRAAQGLHSGRRLGAAGALLRLREARVDGPPVLRQVRVVAPPIPLLLSIPLLSYLFWSASIEGVTDHPSLILLCSADSSHGCCAQASNLSM